MNSTIGELPKSSSYNFIFRQEVWRVGVDAAGDNYLTGVGLGSFRRVFTNDYESNISPEIDIAHAHNIFLQVLLDLGVPGLAAYLALLLISVNIGWNLISTYDPLKPLAISLLAGLFGFHIYSLTDTISLGSKTHFVFWLLMGILAGLPQMSKENGVIAFCRRKVQRSHDGDRFTSAPGNVARPEFREPHAAVFLHDDSGRTSGRLGGLSVSERVQMPVDDRLANPEVLDHADVEAAKFGSLVARRNVHACHLGQVLVSGRTVCLRLEIPRRPGRQSCQRYDDHEKLENEWHSVHDFDPPEAR
jgi:hypothetical protein